MHPLSDNPANGPDAPSAARALRLFIALETAADVQEAIAAAQRGLRRYGELPVRWTNPAQAHLTLRFLGNVMETQVPPLIAALHPVAARHAPFLLRVGAVGAFPSMEAPRVLWLGVEGAVGALNALQRDVAGAIRPLEGIAADEQRFRAHLTLGRVVAGRGNQSGSAAVAKALTGTVAVPPAGWPVSSFALIRSVLGAGGPRYTVVERFALHEERATR